VIWLCCHVCLCSLVVNSIPHVPEFPVRSPSRATMSIGTGKPGFASGKAGQRRPRQHAGTSCDMSFFLSARSSQGKTTFSAGGLGGWTRVTVPRRAAACIIPIGVISCLVCTACQHNIQILFDCVARLRARGFPATRASQETDERCVSNSAPPSEESRAHSGAWRRHISTLLAFEFAPVAPPADDGRHRLRGHGGRGAHRQVLALARR
jgi:hypothetical protein